MTNLSVFLSQNAIQEENERHIVSDRFRVPVLDEEGKPKNDEDGKPLTEPVEWEVRGIDTEEDEAIRKQHTKRMPVPGKKNQFQPVTDYDAYLATLAVKCTVYPNLHDKELQDSYKTMGAEATLKKMLKPGEYADYLKFIQNKNGFDVGLDELVEEAKN